MKAKKVNAEAQTACLLILQKEINETMAKLRAGRSLINTTAKNQRTLKAKIGVLHKLKRTINSDLK